MAQAVDVMSREWQADFEGVDWNRLRAEDPTEFALKRADFDDRRRRIEGYQKQHGEQLEQVKAQYEQEQYRLMLDGQKVIQEAMSGPDFAHAPEWDEAEQQRLYKAILDDGIPEHIVAKFVYPQPFIWKRKAMLYDAAVQEAKKAPAKRQRQVRVKSAAPGARKSKNQVKRSKLDEAKIRQRKAGGSVDATADRISAILRGG